MVRELIFSESLKNDYRKESNYFVRNRILRFPDIIIAQIRMVSKSLSVEISNFISRVKGKTVDLSKQAYSKARLKIKYEVYQTINNLIVTEYYKDKEYLKLFKGYLVFAIDGVRLQLPNEKELIAYFGTCIGGGEPMAMSQCSMLYDVLNKMTICSVLGKYIESEQEQAVILLKSLKEKLDKFGCNVIILLDRGYPSLYLLYYMQMLGLKYVARVSSEFIMEVREFIKSSETDQILKIDLDKHKLNKDLKLLLKQTSEKELTIRSIKVEISSGTEYLLSNLTDSSFTTEDFSELYNFRWGVEGHYNFIKNYIEIENFSSKCVDSLKQDFYGGILASNIRTLLVNEAQAEINKEETEAPEINKYHYEVNQAVALGLVVNELDNLLYSKEDLSEIYARLKMKIKKHKNPVIPNRSFPRKKKKSGRKFNINQRRVL